MNNFTYTQIIDISVSLTRETAIYPGNPPVEIDSFKSVATGSVNSKIVLGTHVGTHIDSPGHALEQGLDIDDLSLNLFIGPCRVLDLTQVAEKITSADLKPKQIQKGERILVKTANSERGFSVFYEDYIYLSGEAAEFLAEQGVILFGIDAWSVKQKGSKDNTPHTALLSHMVPILEGIDLKHVSEGEYTLVALPLKIHVKDGAPARALLLK